MTVKPGLFANIRNPYRTFRNSVGMMDLSGLMCANLWPFGKRVIHKEETGKAFT
jgi:hypothetical protein